MNVFLAELLREELQPDWALEMMTESKIKDFSIANIDKKRQVVPIALTPEGESTFLLCVIQGMRGPVQTFIMYSANCWLDFFWSIEVGGEFQHSQSG